MSRLSVVVPVYNVEGYLDWCLSSLERQTFGDFEVVCVNDGSTDGSREKLGAWARRDGRIRIIDKPNGGLSSARNAGIRAATSPYVCFLDSDDRFHAGACGAIVRQLDKTGADVLTFGATCYPADASYPWLEEVLSPRDVIYDVFSPDILFKEASRPFAWRTACTRDFLLTNDVLFDETVRFGEDQVFDFAIYPRAKRVALSSSKLYDYRSSRAGSLMDRLSRDFHAKMLEHVKIVAVILEDWEKGGFLGRYPQEMLGFALDFALYDAMKLDDASYRDVAGALREVLAAYWTAEQARALAATPALKAMASACYGPGASMLARKAAVTRRYAELYGLRAASRRIVDAVFPHD